MFKMQNLTYFWGIFVIILTLPLWSSSALGPEIKVKAVPPVYRVEVKDVSLYEATIPIFFHIQLPKIPEDYSPENIHHFKTSHKSCTADAAGKSNVTADYRHYQCALERQFILASNHIVKDLQMQRTQFFSKHEVNGSIENKADNFTESLKNISLPVAALPRNKRQVAPVVAAASLLAGFLLRPAVSKFTGNLFGSNEEWASHFNAVRESLIKDHELLLDFEQSTQAYTKEMADIISTMSEILSEQKRDLIWSLRLLSTKMHSDLIQAAVQSCKTKHLPGNLIQPHFLQRTLSTLDKNLTASLNYTLAIDSSDQQLGKYYKLPIADCLFTEDKVHVTLNVPLRRKGVEWKLYEIIHTKFAFQNQICQVYPQEATYLAEENGQKSRGILITNHMLRYCSVYEDQLCMVPRYGKDSSQSLKCISLAAQMKNGKGKGRTTYSQRAEAIQKSCSFQCYDSDEVIITQVDYQTIVVTNADNVTYECGGGSKKETFPVDRLGALEVNLECDCSIKINGKEMLPNPLPCAFTKPLQEGLSGNGEKSMFTFTMPFAWAHNLSGILEEWEGMEATSSRGKLGAHVNHEWWRLVAVLNFTKSQQEKGLNFSVPQMVTEASYEASVSVEIWLGLLTVIVLVHLGLTFYCSFKLFMMKMRGEYELPPVRSGGRRGRDDDGSGGGWYFFGTKGMPNLSPGNFEMEHIRRNEKLDVSRSSKEGEESVKSIDGYQSNRNSVLNKLI